MHPILRNILAVIAGIIAGSAVNMGIIMLSGSVIPPPEGADIATMEGLKESMHLFRPINFLMPFLAHALGTFAGALVAARIAANHKMFFALLIGAFFLIGGIQMVISLPSPLWYNVVDLVGAYFPFAYLAGLIVTKRKS